MRLLRLILLLGCSTLQSADAFSWSQKPLRGNHFFEMRDTIESDNLQVLELPWLPIMTTPSSLRYRSLTCMRSP